MGANSATKLVRILANTERVLGIELMTAAQALEFRRPLKSSKDVEALFTDFRSYVPFIEVDTVMSPLLQKSVDYIRAVCY